MRARFLLALALSAPAAAQELDARSLRRVKEATAYVYHVGFRGLEMGSGVLFRKDGSHGWVLTCEHVVREAKEVTVIFHSGTDAEKVVKAEIVVRDREADLACLRIPDGDLPAPLDIPQKADLRETQTVYVSGFPFGQALATGREHPDVTVTRISVTSLRKDEAGALFLVQLSGDVNPGNSGGPVLDDKARLAGIATSRIQGTATVFAVPPERIRPFLRERVVSVEAKASESGVSVTARLFDPFGKLQAHGVAWAKGDSVKEAPAADADGKWKPLTGSMKEVKLNEDAAACASSGTLDSGGKVWIQGWYVRADGTKVWMEPRPVEALR